MGGGQMENKKLDELINHIYKLIKQSFRGILIIKSSNNLQWNIYLRLGHCSWVTGGINPHGRFQRHLALFCPQLTPEKLQKIASENTPHEQKIILVNLQKHRLIERQQIARLMQHNAIEVFFDIIQHCEADGCTLSYEKITEDVDYNLCLLLPVIKFESIMMQAQRAWHQWKEAGLTKYSPNLFPFIKQPQILENSLTNQKAQEIVSLINGKQSLRTIALKHKVKVLTLTRFLVSFANIGAIGFSRVPYQNSFELSATKKLASSNIIQPQQSSETKSPLVMCVDDSPVIGKAVEKIVSSHNYRYISIQESMKVMPLVLRHKPDFIFLDLMMPVINGYELCAKLRKAPSLKDIPIVILTGKDGLIDRMRAKLVGSTDFMAKPVEKSAVLSMLEKYLINNKRVFVRN